MPVNTKARYYQWYMTENPDARIVYFEWWPYGGRIESSMSPGDMSITQRQHPDHVWGPPKKIATSVPWVVAQKLALDQGFTVEQGIV